MSDTTQSQIQHLPINSLEPNPLQPRASMDKEELDDLMLSIQLHGVLEPLVVAHTPAGYQIIAGERRWRAAKLAGLKEVPAMILETSPKGMLEMALIENVQRVNLHVLDRAKAFDRLLREFGLTVGLVAQRIGKSQAYVSNSLRMLTLPDAIKDGLLSGAITEGHARALSAIEDTKMMVEAYKTLLREDGSVRRAEDLARRMKQQATPKPVQAGQYKTQFLVSDQIDSWQAKLQNSFGSKSQVKLTRSRSQTRVTILLKGSPEETQPILNKLLTMAKPEAPKTDTLQAL